jgi:hypothetical protein
MPEWAEKYQRLGLRLFFWERTGNPKDDWKKAIGEKWNDRHRVYDLAQFNPERHNVGTIIGYEIQPGRFLADVDLDWSPPRELLTLLPASDFMFGRPGKPISHLFFTTPERLPSLKEYKDVDGTKFLELFGGDFTQYTMIPPSLRAPNEPLVPYNGRDCAVTSIEVEELYRHLRNYAIAVVLYRNFGHRGVLHEQRLAINGFLLKEGLPDEDVKAIGRAVTMATGNDVNDWDLAFLTTLQKVKAGETRIAGRTKLIDSLGDSGKKVVSKIKQLVGNSEFVLDQHGKILPTKPENIRVALEKMDVRLFFDDFGEEPLCQIGDQPPRLVDDYVRVPLRLRIEERFHFLPPSELFGEVLLDEALSNRVHPIRTYLDNLVWDGTPRLDRWLIEFGGAADTELVRSVSAKVLIAAVRRVREPGCKFDELLVLESQQGKAKSTAIQTLCPNPDWFSDSLPLGVDAQKVVEQTSGKWIIEASEMHGSRGKEVEQLKAFLSRAVDGPVRLAYHRSATRRPRQFILIGTINNFTGYLKDPTGGRRFWPVRIKEFNVAALRQVRDHLWAEAAHREARGESIRLEEHLWEAAAIEQEDRRGGDPWEEPVEEIVNGQDVVPVEPLWAALGFHDPRMRTTRDRGRIADIMQRLGFVSDKRRVSIRDENGRVKQLTCWVKEDFQIGVVVEWSLPEHLREGTGGDPGM